MPLFFGLRPTYAKIDSMESISQKIDAFFNRKLWRTDQESADKAASLRIRAVRILYVLIKGSLDEQLILRAMSLVYTTLLSIVPLLAVSFSVLKAFGVHTRFLIFLYYFLEPLGQSGMDISMKIIGFVENVKVGVLGSIGLSVLVYTVLSMIQKIESALNYIWNIRDTRGFSQRFSNYMSVLLIGPVLIFSAVGITASLMSSAVMQKLMQIHLLGIIIYAISRIMPYLLVSTAFTLIYIFLPNTRVRFRAALSGGIAAAVLWQTIGWIFTSFIATSAHYSAIYSGFATIILFLIWLYWNFLTLLIGAKVSFYVQHPHLLAARGGGPSLSSRGREKVALAIMFLIGRSFHVNGPPWDFDSLTKRLRISAPLVQQVLFILKEKGLLATTSGEPPAYIPAKDLEIITLNEIIEAVRTSGGDSAFHGNTLTSFAAAESIMESVDNAIALSLENQTLRSLIVDADARTS